MKYLVGIKMYAIALAGFVLAVVTFGASQKRKGRKAERKLQERIDHEKASDIRKRVDDVGSVSDDDLKFRD